MSDVAPPRQLPVDRRAVAAGLLLASAGVIIESVAFLAVVFHSPDELSTVAAAAWVLFGVAYLLIALAVLSGVTHAPTGWLSRVLSWVPAGLLALVAGLHVADGLTPTIPWLGTPLGVWYLGGSYLLFGVVSLLARRGRWPHRIAVMIGVGFAVLALDSSLIEETFASLIFGTADSALWTQPIRGLILVVLGVAIMAVTVRPTRVNRLDAPPRSTFRGLVGALLGLGLANILVTNIILFAPVFE